MKKKNGLRRFFTLDMHNHEGFTLIELIVVIAITAILAGVAVPAYGGYIEKSKRAADEQVLAAMNVAYASACMENGEFDMKNLTHTSPKATIDAKGIVSVDDANQDAFERYNEGNGVFKFYDRLIWNRENGVFTGENLKALVEEFKKNWKESNYDDGTGALAKILLQTFDGIGTYFGSAADNMSMFSNMLLGNTSSILDGILGVDDMFAGVEGAMKLSDDEIAAYVAAYEEKYGALPNEDAKAELIQTIKGNAGVLYFAQEAAGKTAEEVKSGVDVFMDVLKAAGDTAFLDEIDKDEFETYYLPYLSTEAQQQYRDNVGSASDYTDFLNTSCSGLGAANFSYAQMVSMEMKARELEKAGVSNTAGISSFGAMYALAAGYYNSQEYQDGLQNGTATKVDVQYGDFSAIGTAMEQEAFWQYYNGDGNNPSSAQKDLEAYLDFMGYMSTGDIDMTSGNAFGGGENGEGGQFDFIWDAIGNSN